VSRLTAHHVPTPRRLAGAAATLAVAVAVLTACGNNATATGAGGTSSGTTQTSAAASGSGSSTGKAVSLTATEVDYSISLDKNSLTAGTYDIEVVNHGSATHDLVVEQNGKNVAKTDSISPGDSARLTVTLNSGSYVFYCSIGNHRSMGMETTVDVS
jgi:plastocyanin